MTAESIKSLPNGSNGSNASNGPNQAVSLEERVRMRLLQLRSDGVKRSEAVKVVADIMAKENRGVLVSWLSWLSLSSTFESKPLTLTRDSSLFIRFYLPVLVFVFLHCDSP